jgi:hypothetical protein
MTWERLETAAGCAAVFAAALLVLMVILFGAAIRAL